MTAWPFLALAAGLMLLFLVTTPAPRRRGRQLLGISLVALGIYALHFGAVEAYTASTEAYTGWQLARFWALLSIPLSIVGLLLARRG